MKNDTEQSCGREPSDKEWMLDKVGLDPVEEHLLAVARHLFQAFAVPASQSWITGLQRAQMAFGTEGPAIFARLLDALQSIRCARRSCYMFNSPTCPCCAGIVTEHERRLFVALAAVRRKNRGRAQAELMMLCEGADTEQSIAMLENLAALLPSTILERELMRVKP